MTYAGMRPPPWMRPPSAGSILTACGLAAEQALAIVGVRVACVAGEDGDRPLALRVHVLGNIPPDLLWLAQKAVEDVCPVTIAITMTSWVTHPRRTVSVYIAEGTAGHIETTIKVEEPGTACGTCGTRAVRARRCGFCGARG